MQRQLEGTKFYWPVIKTMYRLYKENASDNEIWGHLKKELSKKSKLEITFDSQFGETLQSFYREVTEMHRGTESLIGQLKWLQKLNQLAFQNHFISYRDYSRMHTEIEAINNSPNNKWLDQLSYLKCENQQEFRAQFLVRFCGISEEQAENLFEDYESPQTLERIKAQYNSFFQRFFEPGIDVKVASMVESMWAQYENKVEMLSAGLIGQLERLLGNDMGRSIDEINLNRALLEIALNNLYQSDLEVQQRLENQVLLIKKALETFSGLKTIKDKGITLHLGKFGSITSGFAGLDADLDLTILTNCYVNEGEFLKILYEFLKKEYQEGDRHSRGRRVLPQIITGAKTPLIAIKIVQSGKSDIKIDIIVNNILGIINSKFLRVYAGVKWVKNLGILVKKWGKSVRLIDKNALSSYAMILMLIHYLIRIKAVKPILDARYRTKDLPHFRFKRLKLSTVEEFEVYYAFKDRSEDVSTVERVNYYNILQGFMKYYAHDIWKESEEMRIITVDQSLDKEVDRDTAITIKDPFDQPHNPGRLRVDSKDFMVQAFKEAHEILFQGKIQNIKRLFQ